MTHENLPPSAENTPSVEPGDFLKSQAEFLINLGDLINVLRVSTEPQRVQYGFEFIPELLDAPLEIPRSITDYLGDEYEAIRLGITKDSGPAPMGSLEMDYSGKTLFISRDFANPRDDVKDTVVWTDVDYAEEIDRVSRHDINDLVIQLVDGARAGSDDELERIDVFSPDSCEVLLDNLPDRAATHTTSLTYQLENGRRLVCSTDGIGKTERLLTCAFSYETATPGRTVVANIDTQNGLAVTFQLQYKNDHGLGTVVGMQADEGDILRLQEVIEETLHKYSQVGVRSTDPSELEEMAFELPPNIE